METLKRIQRREARPGESSSKMIPTQKAATEQTIEAISVMWRVDYVPRSLLSSHDSLIQVVENYCVYILVSCFKVLQSLGDISTQQQKDKIKKQGRALSLHVCRTLLPSSRRVTLMSRFSGFQIIISSSVQRARKLVT